MEPKILEPSLGRAGGCAAACEGLRRGCVSRPALWSVWGPSPRDQPLPGPHGSRAAALETPWAHVFLSKCLQIRPRWALPSPFSFSPLTLAARPLAWLPTPQDSPRVSWPQGDPGSRISQTRLLTRTGCGPALPSVCPARGPRSRPGLPCGQLESPARGEATVPRPSRPQTLRSLGRGDGRARLRPQVWPSKSVALGSAHKRDTWR